MLISRQVIVAYTITAGLVVLMITGYYFMAYQPELDSFRKAMNADLTRDISFLENFYVLCAINETTEHPLQRTSCGRINIT